MTSARSRSAKAVSEAPRRGSWNRPEAPVRLLLEDSLEWIRRRKTEFSPLDEERRSIDVEKFKATVELSLACAVASGWPTTEDLDRRWRSCAEPAIEFFGLSDGLQAFLSRNVEFASAVLIGRLLLESHGCPVPDAFPGPETIDELLKSRGSCPFEELEARWLKKMLFGSPEITRDLWERTLAASVPEIDAMRTQDAYSVTHAIFYATEWGTARPAFLQARIGDSVELVRALGSLFANRKNADLVAELVLCHQFLDGAEPAAGWSARMWEFLRQAATAGGGIEPAPGLEPASDESDFLRQYHTTLAVALAATHAIARQ